MRDTTEMVDVKHEKTPGKMRHRIFDELRRDLADWMTAKRDLVWRPAIEITEENNEFAARVLVPGVEAKDLEVLIAPEMALIKGTTDRGEPTETKLLRSINFPRAVNPNAVHAEIKDGMLCIRAKIANVSHVTNFMPRAA